MAARLPKHHPLYIPADMWDRPDVHAALISCNFQELFRLVLATTRCSQETLGQHVRMTQTKVSEIVRGKRTVSTLKVVRSVVDGLDMPDHALDMLTTGALGRCPQPAMEEDPMHRRDLLRASLAAALTSGVVVHGALGDITAATAHQPDQTTAGHLDGLVRTLRAADVWGGLYRFSASLVDMCRQALAAARPSDRPAIGRVLAEAAMEHWWQAWQDGRPDDPAAFADAMALASEWDRPQLVAHLLTFRSGTALREDRDPVEALRLARLARDARWRPSPGEVARAASHEARAAGVLGDRTAALRAIDVREDALASIDPATEPSWLDWFTAQAPLEVAGCHLVRGGAAAIPIMETALADVDPDQTRTLAVFRGFIASARVDAGDVDGAVVEIGRVAELTKGRRAWSMGELACTARARRLQPVTEALADYGLLSA